MIYDVTTINRRTGETSLISVEAASETDAIKSAGGSSGNAVIEVKERVPAVKPPPPVAAPRPKTDLALCPDCRKAVSRAARSCPSCGCEINGLTPRQLAKARLMVLLGAAVACPFLVAGFAGLYLLFIPGLVIVVTSIYTGRQVSRGKSLLSPDESAGR